MSISDMEKLELHHRRLFPQSPISHPIKGAKAFSAFTPRLNISSEVEKLCHSSRCHSTVPLWRWLVRRRSARMAIAHCQALTARHRPALPNCLRGAVADMTWMSRRRPRRDPNALWQRAIKHRLLTHQGARENGVDFHEADVDEPKTSG